VTNAICRKYTLLHQTLGPYIESQIDETLRSGVPLVRPHFWPAPLDRTALAIDDQFLLAARLLVAPMVQQGQRARDVYLPAGRWRDLVERCGRGWAVPARAVSGPAGDVAIVRTYGSQWPLTKAEEAWK
jgi:Glycosyl hydrolases family 31